MERLTDPLTTTDAKLWADEFMKVKARLGEQKFDHAMMLGWFANAIMVGYDEGSRRAKADVQATVEALQRERDALKLGLNALRDSYDELESRHNDTIATLDATTPARGQECRLCDQGQPFDDTGKYHVDHLPSGGTGYVQCSERRRR